MKQREYEQKRRGQNDRPGIVDVYDTAVDMARFTIPQPQPMPCSILWAVLVVVLSAWCNKGCTRQQLEAELYIELNVFDSLILKK